MPNLQNVERNAAIVKLWNAGRTAVQIVAELEAEYPDLTAPAVRGIVKRSADAEQRPGGPKGKGKGKRRPKGRRVEAGLHKAAKAVKPKGQQIQEGLGKALKAARQETERYTLRLPPDVGTNLRLYAASRRMALSDVVAEALKAMFKRKPPVP